MPEAARDALSDKTAHEWGYRYVWPPLVDNLTLRQYKRIQLAERAESYLQYQRRQKRQNGDSLTHEHYDDTKSRQEWADQWRDAPGAD